MATPISRERERASLEIMEKREGTNKRVDGPPLSSLEEWERMTTRCLSRRRQRMDTPHIAIGKGRITCLLKVAGAREPRESLSLIREGR